MRVDRFQLLEENRLKLKSVIELLGVTQASLAERAGVSPTWLSNILKGKRAHPERRMLGTLFEEIKESLNSLSIRSDSESPELNEALEFMESMLAEMPGEKEPAFIAFPGGAIPLGAKNYIERDEDLKAYAFSGNEDPHTAAIIGPPQSGVTSLLGRCCAVAEKKNISVIYFDCKLAAPSRIMLESRKSSKRIQYSLEESIAGSGQLFFSLAETMQAGWDLRKRYSSFSGGPAFLIWLRQAIQTSHKKSHLLILDGITSLNPVTAEHLLATIRTMTNMRSEGKLPIKILVGMVPHTPEMYSIVAKSSSWDIYKPEIRIKWFSKNQVNNFFSTYEDQGIMQYADQVYLKFGGQPFLTHIAASKIHEDKLSLNDVYEMANCGSDQFAQHIRILRDLLSYDDSGQLYQSFSKVCEGEIKKMDDNNEDLKLLCDFNLIINEKGHLRAASDYYSELKHMLKPDGGL